MRNDTPPQEPPVGTVPTETAPASPPTKFSEYVRSLGPGIVVVVSWLGTGDFISASVSGSNFGYALIWTLLIAILSRYFIVSTMSRYQLCNSVGDETILDGYGRVWRGFPMYIGATTCVLGFIYVSFLLIAAGTALDHLFTGVVALGQWGTFLWAVPTMVAALWLASRRSGHYRALEIVAQITMGVLVISFLVALVGTGVDFGKLFGGLLFEMPPGEAGYITAASTAVGLIGAVGGSAANLLYPYLMHEKGWRGSGYRKLQRLDLRFGTLVMFGLVLAVWVVAAETLHGTGQGVSSADGLALMMEKAIGPAGPSIMWCAVFFTVFNNIVTQPRVFVRMFTESLHKSRPARAERIRAAHPSGELNHKELFLHDRLFWVIFTVIMTVPLVFSLPVMPGMVVLTLMGNSVNVLTVPAVIIGLIVMTTRRDLMPRSHVNKWWQTTILVLIGAVGLWATYELVLSIVNLGG
ncbi:MULTISPECIES: Nramp family divalent metal transporter [unclassified Actinopolyspora]|uniref:Nramp family divalent metal transporter n=1 Tax=unclassified Actinopolyspora TaxID=2639451 RepID=UPI0013F5BA1A|nr:MULTISPECIES: Nramp family divalent metal transporter [unclassified Actinopolyspora]NHD15953.1 divalent metal cation transporter [Actinopolyspora sp. BKK2]NHE74833.1 divalent metal cation transporter [Actinopolyspora sp. BKK1]